MVIETGREERARERALRARPNGRAHPADDNGDAEAPLVTMHAGGKHALVGTVLTICVPTGRQFKERSVFCFASTTWAPCLLSACVCTVCVPVGQTTALVVPGFDSVSFVCLLSVCQHGANCGAFL